MKAALYARVSTERAGRTRHDRLPAARLLREHVAAGRGRAGRRVRRRRALRRPAGPARAGRAA